MNKTMNKRGNTTIIWNPNEINTYNQDTWHPAAKRMTRPWNNREPKKVFRYTMRVRFLPAMKNGRMQEGNFTYRGDMVQRAYAKNNKRIDSPLFALRLKLEEIAETVKSVVIYDNALAPDCNILFKMTNGVEIINNL